MINSLAAHDVKQHFLAENRVPRADAQTLELAPGLCPALSILSSL